MNFERIARHLPVAPLLQKLTQHPAWWTEETLRQEFLGSAHHATQTIYLRGPLGFTFEEYFMDTAAIDFPHLPDVLDVLMPVLRPLLDAIEWSELGRVLVVNLPAGASLDEHTDQGAYAEHYARFHVALETNRGAHLIVDGESTHMEAGEAYWFDHHKPHYARNRGERDRIHLIVDAVSPRFDRMTRWTSPTST
jgi:hypothetical protein